MGFMGCEPAVGGSPVCGVIGPPAEPYAGAMGFGAMGFAAGALAIGG